LAISANLTYFFYIDSSNLSRNLPFFWSFFWRKQFWSNIIGPIFIPMLAFSTSA
jgi:fumarate reductase subunit D